ncbi:MAG: molybdopterin molybdotransferase MoeA [Bryobacterales bacterium]|nr:molybdopterin molybdotransferase MoeA [Bryobacterales bacterium]
MPTYSFPDARRVVIETITGLRKPATEYVHLEDAAGRVLGEAVHADRDYPPVARSIRDGFAVRAADVPGWLRVIGEVRAGDRFEGEVGPGECVEIMTGAPMPVGADAVVMVEYTRREGDRMVTERGPAPGEFVNPQGSEAREGQTMLEPGKRLRFPDIAMLATYGMTHVRVYKRPEVAILSTGDEVVPVEAGAQDNQVRNSNAWALAAQVRSAGGIPKMLPIAPDRPEATLRLMKQGLESDLLLLSGGVSAGKYDYVEPVLAELGATFLFDRALIQPGQPVVFGLADGKPFFGLPGNPASTMVCFHIFARAAVELLAGQVTAELPMPRAKLTAPFTHKTGLTRFLPARLSADGSEVSHIPWQGSSDVPAIAKGNAFLVADPDTPRYEAGDLIPVILYT